MNTPTPDEGQAEIFAERVLTLLNNAALALMISIGHQTGLFDTMATLPPCTSTQIAEAAGLQERYVREWLNAMVVGDIAMYDPAHNTYFLPPAHAAALTRAAGPGNLALEAQYISLLGNVEQDVVQSFFHGGGVPYSRYPRFQQLMAEDSATDVDRALLQTTLPLVPGLVKRLEAGIAALDVGCGQGHAANVMAQAFPRSQFNGYDFSREGIAAAQAEAAQKGLTNTHFEARDLATLDAAHQFDLITAFDAIHDQAQPDRVLQAIARGLKPDGTFLMVDIGASSAVEENHAHPLGAFLYTISCMHCMTVSLAQGGMGLGAMWGEQKALDMLKDAGFAHVTVRRIPDDIQNAYYIATRG